MNQKHTPEEIAYLNSPAFPRKPEHFTESGLTKLEYAALKLRHYAAFKEDAVEIAAGLLLACRNYGKDLAETELRPSFKERLAEQAAKRKEQEQ